MVIIEVEKPEPRRFHLPQGLHRKPDKLRTWTAEEINQYWKDNDMYEEKLERRFQYERMRHPRPQRFSKAWFKERRRLFEFWMAWHPKEIRTAKKIVRMLLLFLLFDAGFAAGWFMHHGAPDAQLQRDRVSLLPADD